MAKSSSSGPKKRTATKQSPKKTSTICSHVAGKVSIVTVTTADIKKAAKAIKNGGALDDTQKSRQQLVRVPSKAERSKIYEEAALAIGSKEASALPSHGGRSWTCDVRVADGAGASGSSTSLSKAKGNKKASGTAGSDAKGSNKGGAAAGSSRKRKTKNSGPLFRFFRGKLELACLPHILEKIPEMDAKLPEKRKTSEWSDDEDEADFELAAPKKTSLQERTVSTLSTVAWEDPDHPIPNVDRTWTSPDLKKFHSRKAAWEHAEELLRRDQLIDRVVHGVGARGVKLRPFKPTKKASLEAGLYRFLRDGIWVIGQEEDWQESRSQALLQKERKRKEKLESEGTCDISEPVETPSLPCNDSVTTADIKGEKLDGTEPEAANSKVGVETSNSSIGDSNGDATHPKKRPRVDLSSLIVTPTDSGTDESSECEQSGRSNGIPDGDQPESKTPGQDDISIGDANEEKASNTTPNTVTSVSKMSCSPLSALTSGDSGEAGHQVVQSTPLKKAKKPRLEYQPRRIPPSVHWRLTRHQIELCYSAATEHYEKVMYTVKARALYSELSDGFDVLRERGRGRYDMELPVFESSTFDFLTDPSKASWIPVVKQILGDDATLVHKGCFISLPGSEAQVYHQDGPHLTTKYQKACHAVNVFIPLVDLAQNNGPTEFCLGTHMLGYECFVKEMVYTPHVRAGTPIIFDYRLGHRGMGNSSSQCRPIVYLTYSAGGGKEFRDSVNFSRKRYRKIGDLVDKPLSREERALKRRGRSG